MWTLALGVSLLGIAAETSRLSHPPDQILTPVRLAPVRLTSVLLTQSSEQSLLEKRQLGMQQFQQGEYRQAITTFRAALNLATSDLTTDLTMEASLYSQLGYSHANLGDYDTALARLDEAQSRYEQLALPTGLAEVNIYRSFVRRRQGNYDVALRLLDTAQAHLAIAEEEGTEIEADIETAQWRQILTGEALHNLAAVKAALGESETAIALNQQALTVWDSLLDPLRQQFHRGRSLNNLGGIYYTLGETDTAQTYSQQALTIAQEIGNQASEGRILTNLGLLDRQAGNLEQAVQRYQTALNILRGLGDRASVSSTLNSLGVVYESLGDYEQALNSYQQGLAIATDIGDQTQMGNSWDGLGGLHYRQARYGKALNAYEKALAIHQAIGNHRGWAATLTNVGGTYANLGRYETALDYFSQALEHSNNNPSIQAGILAAQGGVYRQLGDLPKALKMSQQGWDWAIAADDVPQQSQLLDQLGGIYGEQGDVEKAVTAYQQAIRVSQERNNGPNSSAAVARSLNSWGTLLINFSADGGLAQAQPLFQSALTTFQQLGDRTGESIVLSNLGKIYEADGQTALAIVFYKQALTAHESIRGELTTLPNELQQSYIDSITPTYRQLADLLLQQDRVLEAQQVIDLLLQQDRVLEAQQVIDL
ncbi:MAG: tetratricopeptide repeat protein, partial [Cyanobacteria bacterium J06555_13]